MRCSQLLGLALVAGAASFSSGLASGQIYLSGAVWYGADANGSTLTEPAEYDNIVGTGNFGGRINATARGTTFLLNDGDNLFTYDSVGGNYNAISMYFSSDAGPFNRAFGSTPDLVVYGSTSPLTPIVGALVQTNGQFSGTKAYAGNNSFTIGDRTVVVTAFTATGNGNGTFTLTVVPSPAGLGVLAAAGVFAGRRRRAIGV
jgi:hypothetical protein